MNTLVVFVDVPVCLMIQEKMQQSGWFLGDETDFGVRPCKI
jgi:hypothetical protein